MPADTEPIDETEQLECCECGDTVSDLSIIHADGESRLCHDCANVCTDCEQHYMAGELTTVWRRHICEECLDNDYFRCADCNDYCHNDHGSQNSGEESVCESCAESYFFCEGCQRTRHTDDYGDDDRCTDCTPDEDDSEFINSDHAARPPSTKRGKGPHYLGVELEVEASGEPDHAAEKTLDLLGDDFVVCKYDGSLSHGFEICTSPATLEYQKTRWNRFFENRPTGLKSYDTSTCGLHVHASRQPLSDLTVGKVLAFVNSRSNYDFIRKIAMRDPAQWAKVKPEKLVSDARLRNTDRYEAVNLQNSRTIEFRIFKGTLKRESFYRALEFVDALVNYAMPAQHGIGEFINSAGFFAHVLRDKKRWPNLAEFVRSFQTLENESEE